MGSFFERIWSPVPLEDNVHLTPMSRLDSEQSWPKRSDLLSTQMNLYRGEVRRKGCIPNKTGPFHCRFSLKKKKKKEPQTFQLPSRVFTWAEAKLNNIDSKLQQQIYGEGELYGEYREKGRERELWLTWIQIIFKTLNGLSLQLVGNHSALPRSSILRRS